MKHNFYKDGDVQNIEFTDSNSDKSVGVVEPGTYEFTTEREETIQCLTGIIEINETKYSPGQKVTLSENEKFTMAAEESSSYLCLYK